MRRLIHAAICFYLRQCGGAFHHGPYGPNGHYVALMTDNQYSKHNKAMGCEVCEPCGVLIPYGRGFQTLDEQPICKNCADGFDRSNP